MYAVIRAGGKQYKVAPGDVIRVEKMTGTDGANEVQFGDVLAVSAEAAIVADPGVAVYPSPSRENCSACDFRAPCLAMQEGADPGPILSAAFRPRTEEEGEEERLRWSIGRAQTRASMSGRDSKPTTVNFHWG